MALTGIQIHKLLPKTNCKECGVKTCMAFAMKLAAKKADLSACPYVSEEAKQIIGAAAEPPVKGVALGPQRTLTLGAETVLYRHEKTFVSPTALAVDISDSDTDEAIVASLSAIESYSLERVGESFGIDMVSVTQTDPRRSDAASFARLANRAWTATGKPLVLRSLDPAALTAAAVAVAGSHSVMAGATAETADALWPVARDNQHALALTAPDLDQLAQLSARTKQAGFDDLLLEFSTSSLAEQLQTSAIARRLALKQSFKPLGYPSLCVVSAGDPLRRVVEAVTVIAKYGSICVLPCFDPALLASLLTLRLNIYTDPQKPIQVEPGLYPIGDPTVDSPVFLTTNFSLTYFLVSGEIENAGISAWLVVPECEGMSVLTAWAAGKFSGSSVARFCAEIDLDARVRSRQLVIPGYVAQISGELEEGLAGWNVLVGPQEAADLDSFIKARLR